MARIIQSAFRLAMVVLVAISGVVAEDARALSDIKFVGTVAYSPFPIPLGATTLYLSASRVENRNLIFTSATLRLELWAFLAPYNGTSQTGYVLGRYVIGTIPAQSAISNIAAVPVPYSAPAAGTYYLSMLVTEYDGSTYVLRDWANFSGPAVFQEQGQLAFPTPLTFPAQPAATSSAPQNVTVTNFGPGTVTISSVGNTGTADFSRTTTCTGKVLPPLSSCIVTVTFTPHAAGSWTDRIRIDSNGLSPVLYIDLAGTGTAAPSPGQLTMSVTGFGPQAIGTSSTQNVTITNTGGQTVTTSSVTVSGTDFTGVASGCAVIAVGSSCNVAVKFTPTATGTRTGSLVVVSNAVGSPNSLQLTGTGVSAATPGQLSMPSTLSFGNQQVGTTSAPQVVTIRNIGGQGVNTSSRTLTGADFAGSSLGCTFIAAGSSCTVTLTFTPLAAGNRSGTLNIVSDGVGSPQSVQLNGVGVTTAPPPTTAAAIEYYHAAFDHYFVTAIADEITKLDNGTFVGWARTGQSFSVYTVTQSGLASVCRFFSTTFAPKSSHFYTPDAPECATVQANPNWQFEAIVFYMAKPDANGNCPPGTQPVYRMYNSGQGAAPNHRYTTSTTVRSQMLAQGWIPEGYGPLGVIMCAPP